MLQIVLLVHLVGKVMSMKVHYLVVSLPLLLLSNINTKFMNEPPIGVILIKHTKKDFKN